MTQLIYKGHDSPILVRVFDVDGERYTTTQMATITRVYVKFTATGETAQYADSDETLSYFDWLVYAATSDIYINLGLLDLNTGRDRNVEVIVYDSVYTNGRVVASLDLTVDESVEDDAVLADPILRLVLNKTDDYTITTSDLGRSIRLNSTTAKTFTLPVGIEALDGKRVTCSTVNTGDVTVAASGSDKVAAADNTQITGSTTYAAVTLEYVWSKTIWMVIEGTGKWTGA